MNLSPQPTESQIVALFHEGDQRAMDVLYAAWGDRLAGVAHRYLGDEEHEHDALQEALIKIFTHIGRFKWRGEGSLRAWMTRIVVNECLTLLRHEQALMEVDIDEKLYAMVDEAPPAAGLRPDQVAEAIAQLPPGQRTVFNLYAVEGLSHQEIAELMGIQPDTSASQYHRARATLARRLRRMQTADDTLQPHNRKLST